MAVGRTKTSSTGCRSALRPRCSHVARASMAIGDHWGDVRRPRKVSTAPHSTRACRACGPAATMSKVTERHELPRSSPDAASLKKSGTAPHFAASSCLSLLSRTREVMATAAIWRVAVARLGEAESVTGGVAGAFKRGMRAGITPSAARRGRFAGSEARLANVRVILNVRPVGVEPGGGSRVMSDLAMSDEANMRFGTPLPARDNASSKHMAESRASEPPWEGSTSSAIAARPGARRCARRADTRSEHTCFSRGAVDGSVRRDQAACTTCRTAP
mmetsp:Transcript_6542/g.16054  ORF Transcript_6542/g.16054 Transcript_6542/m.16054 type:complete len:274 (+) Transcript_6542:516-1337(+)